MLLVYHLANRTHPEERHCRQFFRQIENGNLTGVVSTFVIQEFIDVVKRLLAGRRGRVPLAEEMARLQERTEEQLNRLGIEVQDADGLAQAVVPNIPPLFDRAGNVILYSGATLGGDGKWRSVGGADAVHVGLAERAFVDYYATCDEGFRQLRANILPAIMREVYP